MKHKIALIEDEADIADMYKAQLELGGYQVDVATDGVSGTSLIKSELPDLVILDLLLPKRDGYAVLRDIRNDEKTKNALVFVLSNLGQTGDVYQGLRSGADHYFVKADVSPKEVYEIVKTALKEHKETKTYNK